MSAPDLIEHEGGAVTLTAERARACLEATWQAEALARFQLELTARLERGEDAAFLCAVSRAVGLRLVDLVLACMAGLSDRGETTEEIRSVTERRAV